MPNKELTPQKSWPSRNKNELVEANKGTNVKSGKNRDVSPNNLGLEFVLKSVSVS
jgi:hypothetical protein